MMTKTAVPKSTPGLTRAEEEKLVRSAYENFPEASMCLACTGWKYDKFIFKFTDDEGVDHVVTLDDAVRGLRLLAAAIARGELKGLGLPANYLSPADDFDVLGEWDAFAFDALNQMAIYGEVIYG